MRPPRLAELPRVRLAALPTPLHRLPRLSERLGVEVWAKRDDLTGLGLGGNKARKLEFLIADALARDHDVLVTGGGPGSNHVQITAAAAARLGLRCVVVLYGDEPPREPANLRLARLLGAEVVFTGQRDRGSVDVGIADVCDRLTREGRRPYAIPRGGASPVGCLGYVEAAFELRDQLAASGVRPSHLFLATGSCGTHAGLLLGARLAGLPARVVGATVSRHREECIRRVEDLAAGCAALLGSEGIDPVDVVVLDGYLGPGYGVASPEGEAAAALVGRSEGLLLDPVFTAKAMAALLGEARAGRVEGPVVFLHTGGVGGLLEGAP